MDTTVLDRKATQLVAASQRQSFDPFAEIDWDLPIDDSTYHLPPEFLPLYGTEQWEVMSEDQRRAYSRHECAALLPERPVDAEVVCVRDLKLSERCDVVQAGHVDALALE